MYCNSKQSENVTSLFCCQHTSDEACNGLWIWLHWSHCYSYCFGLSLSTVAVLSSSSVYIQATGQEIPAIVVSCIRIINLYGNSLCYFYI